MNRRDFLTTSLTAAGAAALVGNQPAALADSASLAMAGNTPAAEEATTVEIATGAGGQQAQEIYELRRYTLHQGANPKINDDYWRNAALPALKRLGIGPVGVFNVMIGPETPALYVLIPHKSAESVLTLPARLEADAEYKTAGAAYLNASLASPAYQHLESSLLVAFAGMPALRVPDETAGNRPRLFELRTYESPSEQTGVRKVEMFNAGEIGLFSKAGFQPVFFGEARIGPKLPSLTYMLAFKDLEARQKCFAAFGADPEFKKLAAKPEYTDLLTNINNVVLQPAPYSQI
jgi:hypothetical protein